MMETQKLIERLMELPEKIATTQLELVESTVNSQDVLNEIVRCETEIKVSIANATDDAGKKKYSNEDARKAAFAEIAEQDDELNTLKSQSRQIERETQLKRIEFDALVNEQKNVRTILMFLSGQNQ